MSRTVADVADDLDQVVKESLQAFEAIDEDDSLKTRGPGTWSRRQILGHLIDSALNNTHRFVRAPREDELSMPDYDQPGWVDAAGYQERSWSSLVDLWAGLNVHLVEVIRRIPSDQLETPCRIGGSDPMALEFVVRDYVRHLRHHLEQILDPEASGGKVFPPFA